jgi:hypothetical protein
MNEFEIKTTQQAEKSLAVIEDIVNRRSTKKIIQDFLDEHDEETGNTNLRDILKAKKSLAIGAKNELVALEAQKSFFKLISDDEESKEKGNVFAPQIIVNAVSADKEKIINQE